MSVVALVRPGDGPAVPAESPVTVEAAEPHRQADSGSYAVLPPSAGRAAVVLRVISGVHLGAEVPIEAERLLIGNLENECDLVLDVGQTGRHACLLRISHDGWTVLPIAGDLWVGKDYLADHQTHAFSAGQPLTLGRIAFAVGEAATTPWDAIRPPYELVKPQATGAIPVAASLGPRPAVLNGWKAVKLGAGVGIGALIFAASLAYSVSVVQATASPQSEVEQRLERARGVLASLPAAAEVRVVADPERRDGIRLMGYVADADRADAIGSALRSLGSPVSSRLHLVANLQSEIERRLAKVAHSGLEYTDDGGFKLETESTRLGAIDSAVRAVFLELPEFQQMVVTVTDVKEAAGGNATLTYRRSQERLSDIVVEGGELIQQTRARYIPRDVRLGAIPSVHIGGAGKYFVGARLPDGWVIDAIGADQIRLSLSGRERSLKVASAAHQEK
jgi:hypothetical protein